MLGRTTIETRASLRGLGERAYLRFPGRGAAQGVNGGVFATDGAATGPLAGGVIIAGAVVLPVAGVVTASEAGGADGVTGVLTGVGAGVG